MNAILHWKGCEYASRESCRITVSSECMEAVSTIEGSYRDIAYLVKYRILANSYWEVTGFSIESQINGEEHKIVLQSNGKGDWTTDGGRPIELFKGCIDIDISLTPFTNTLLIRRLDLSLGEASEIQVLYLDILNGETKPVRQKYTRMSPAQYLYENVPNNFEALITVDSDGLVIDYPELFKRT
ncbi:hypothetical protein EDD80_11545 [Anseongella ginsenosidimutans]|uniref:Glycolipid-binding protein n=2 Tax=Anseongella ginsenosidimutans TaxID=496056 RepID=A0A4R3KLY6_9SPHI|nr:hypothetical protein EDD80_11545 [Anseongella ginsenosidimutans]